MQTPAPHLDQDPGTGDPALVARVLAGEVELFQWLVRRHNQSVYRAVRAIGVSDDDAEDVMQEAYVSAFTHLSGFEGRASFKTWLVRIAVHEGFARQRRTRRTLPIEEADDVMATNESPEAAASDIEMRALLEKTIERLPVAFRAVFILRAVEDLSVEDTATTLGIPPETVRTRHHRARAMLRADLLQAADAAAPNTFAFHLSRCDRVTRAVLSRILDDDPTSKRGSP